MVTIVSKVFYKIDKDCGSHLCGNFPDTPMIVQAMIIFYGLRQSGVSMTTTFAGILVTTLNTGAYMAETVRGGIGSIDLGQREGAWAMGMSPMKTMLYIVLPQAFRNIIPEMANTFFNKSENDVSSECDCSSGIIYGSKNCRWQLL